MIYRLLGEMTIDHDGQPLTLPGGHCLVVLATLLINANRRLSKETLMRAAWGQKEVGQAQLHKCASALRALLKGVGRQTDLVTHQRHGYELRVADEDLDLLVFQRLIQHSEIAAKHRRLDEEVELLRQAMGLWRGSTALSNLPSGALRPEAIELEQRRKRVAVRLFDLEFSQGRYGQVLEDLIAMAAHHPTDRRISEQLMIALYRCGHGAEALEAYERHATAVADETGGAPEGPLKGLWYAIARNDEPAITKAEAAITAQTKFRPGATAPRQLPRVPSDFVGRDELVTETRSMLTHRPNRAVPVVVVSGPSGIGKTALALHVAHQVSDLYPDGQIFVDLRGSAGHDVGAGEVLAHCLRSLGVTKVPETEEERLATYRTVLADRTVLIVLDDAFDEEQVRNLVPGNPSCGVLITARQRLPAIDGVRHTSPLGPLDEADGRELFLRTVRHGGVDATAEAEATDQVVALCFGLPLAIRIAGALRVRDHPRTTAELAERLARQGPDALQYREQSVARGIGASLDRLDEDARHLFFCLGLARLPTFGLWTASALLRDETSDPSAALSQLASSFLIHPTEHGRRYRFHELTREYAVRRAAADHLDSPERIDALGQVYTGLLTLTRRAHRGLYGGDFEVIHSDVRDWEAPDEVLSEVDASAHAWFDIERINIRVAVERCAQLGLTEVCWDLCLSAHEYYTIFGYFDDWHATHVVALEACRAAGDDRGEGAMLVSLGQPALVASRRTGGTTGPAELERAVQLFADHGDRHGQAIALRTLANALRRQGELIRPLALFTRALGFYEAAGDAVGQWQSLRFIGQTHLEFGRPDEAMTVLRKADVAARSLNRPRLVAQTCYWIGQTALALGDIGSAREAFGVVRDIYDEPDGVGYAYAAHGLGDVARLSGDRDEAERLLGLAVVEASRSADARLEGRVHRSLAELAAARHRPGEHARALRHAADCFAACGAPYLEADALDALAAVEAQRRQPAAARDARLRAGALRAVLDRSPDPG